jgi:membrane-associated protease RseP (regulator of RpoE activity)
MNGSRGLLAGLLRARVAIFLAGLIVALIVLDDSHLTFLLGILIFIVALMISVMLHEFGHFITAKKFGMRVTQFFLGFGTTLWSMFRGETEYGVKALPFGGFVKITGMTSMDEIDAADEPRSFRRQPGWQRVIVLAAGAFMHFVLALVLFFALAVAIGQETSTNQVSALASCIPPSNAALNSNNPCPHGHGTTPAQTAGIKANDTIISVNGHSVANFNQLHTVLKSQPTHVKLPIVVKRNGRDVRLEVTLASVRGDSTPYLGVDSVVAFEPQNPFSAVAFAGTQFAGTITSSVQAIGKLPAAIPDLFNKDRARTPAGQVSSVVGVGAVTGDVVEAAIPWQAKVWLVVYLVASLNIFVGLFNLLPLLPLDGGHMWIVIYERVRAWFARLFGRPDPGLVDIQKLVPVSLLVFAVLVGVGTLLILADIINPVHIQV